MVEKSYSTALFVRSFFLVEGLYFLLQEPVFFAVGLESEAGTDLTLIHLLLHMLRRKVRQQEPEQQVRSLAC